MELDTRGRILMLDKTTFLKGLKYMNAYYASFNFNINDDYKIGVWYNIFKEVNNETYTGLIKNYCEKNIYAPQSPTHLLEYAKDIMIQNKLTAEEAWERAVTSLRNTGYNFKRSYTELDQTTVNSIKQMEAELTGILTKDMPYARNHFIEIYKREARKEVEQETKEGLISRLQITQNS